MDSWIPEAATAERMSTQRLSYSSAAVRLAQGDTHTRIAPRAKENHAHRRTDKLTKTFSPSIQSARRDTSIDADTGRPTVLPHGAPGPSHRERDVRNVIARAETNPREDELDGAVGARRAPERRARRGRTVPGRPFSHHGAARRARGSSVLEVLVARDERGAAFSIDRAGPRQERKRFSHAQRGAVERARRRERRRRTWRDGGCSHGGATTASGRAARSRCGSPRSTKPAPSTANKAHVYIP